MKTCFLHVGFHKTATTSFQLTLQHNRKLLEEEGIFLPKFRSKTKEFSANHSGQIRDLFDENALHLWQSSGSSSQTRDSKELTIQDHYQSLAKLLNNDHNILISGEAISCLSEQSLIRLKEKIEACGFLIKPFALVRSPYAFVTSALQQTIKNGEYHPWIKLIPSQDNEVKNIFKIPTRSDSVRTLNRIFEKKMVYIPFNAAKEHPSGPVLFLLQEVLHLKYLDQYELINANESRSNLSTRIKNHLNQKHPNIDKGKLRSVFNKTWIQSDQPKFLLTEKEFDQIKSKFEEARMEMEILLGKEFTEEKIAFSPEVSTHEAVQILSEVSQKLYKIAARRN